MEPAVRRPAARGRRGRRHRADPVHVAAPEGPASRDGGRRWPSARASASTSTSRCSRAATPCWRGCAGLHGRALPREARDGARHDRRPRGDHRHHRGLPRRDRRRLRGTLALVDAARYDAAYTFVFSPRPGTAAAAMEADFVPEAVAGAHAPADGPGRAPRAGRSTRRGSAGSRRSSSRVRPRRTRRSPPAAPARTSSSTSPASSPPAARHASRSRGGPPHWLRGDARRGGRRPARRPHSHPGDGGLSRGHPSRTRRSHRVGEIGARARGGGAARRRRARLDRLDAGVPRHGHRHGQADVRRSAPEFRTT